jgi:hypothetical protein
LVVGSAPSNIKNETEMAAWWGEALYWVANLIAGLIVAWVVWSYAYNGDRGDHIIAVIPLLLAGAIWLLGRACRSGLAGR